MKKGLILAAALVLVATSALASSVVGSAHDMNGQATLTSNVSQEVCVFCHTPHAANTAVSKAPLWNRTLTPSAMTLYNSTTLDQVNSRPGVVSASIANSDAPLCLSCHDGTAVAAALFNPPNAGAPVWGAFTWANATANIGGGSNNLSNDHPIGMVYDNVQGADTTGFQLSSSFTGKLDLYDGGKVWCSTCHDVHDDQYYPFLATSNTASALCVTCHIK